MKLGPFPLVSVGKAVAGTVILAVLAVYLVIIAPLFAVLLPLPVAYVTARHGWLAGGAVVVVSALLLYPGTGPGVALLTFLLTVSLGLTPDGLCGTGGGSRAVSRSCPGLSWPR